MVEVGGAEGGEEFSVVDHVERFRLVNGHSGGAFWFCPFEALCHLGNKGQQCCGT